MRPLALRAVPVLALLLVAAPVARADPEETERRLKTAGVDAALRTRIHDAIRRGARWIASQQRANGTFDLGQLVPLCGLALQHAAVPEAGEPYRRCRDVLLTREGELLETYYRGTYEAGLTALLLRADGHHEDVLRKLGAAFVHGEGGDGFWGYSNAQKRGKGAGNLSTSQFATLALQAAGRSGFAADPKVWTRHVEYLLASQTVDGSFGYGGSGPSYPTGTFMGLANLIVARQALGDGADAALRSRMAEAHARAEAVLPRDVNATIAAFRRGVVRDYYALFALEKVAIFLDREELGGLRWYVAGAEALLAVQGKDGRWPSGDYRYWLAGSRSTPGGRALPASRARDLEATAFAVLFLLRTWETFHPVTPRSLDVPATTPGSASAEAEAPAAAPPPALPALPLDLASDLLAELEALLRRRDAENAAVVAAIERVADAYDRLRGAAGEVDAWRRRAEALLLRALGLARGAARRRPIQVAAAVALGATLPRVSGEMRRIAARGLLASAEDDPDGTFPAAFFGSLARLGELASLRWMIEEHFVSGGSRGANLRCEAALRAARIFEGVPGALRREAVERLVRAYAPMERAGRGGGKPASGAWTALAPEVVLSVQHFARDADGLPPRSDGVEGGWIVSMQEFERWWRDHDRADRPPWR